MELRSLQIGLYIGALALAACGSSNGNSTPFAAASPKDASTGFNSSSGGGNSSSNGGSSSGSGGGNSSSNGGSSSGGQTAGCSQDSDCNGMCDGATCCCMTGSPGTCYPASGSTCGGDDSGSGDDGSINSTSSGGGGMQTP